MRMWMINPEMMCNQHLLGEHVECHMIDGTLKKDRKITGYLKNNLAFPCLLKSRHLELVKEMKNRGMTGHKTPLVSSWKKDKYNRYFDDKQQVWVRPKPNIIKSHIELIKRCKKWSRR